MGAPSGRPLLSMEIRSINSCCLFRFLSLLSSLHPSSPVLSLRFLPLVRRHPSSAASEFASPSPQSPVAAALPVFPNAPACLGRTITIKGEISGQDDLFLDGTFEGKIHIAEGSFTAGPNARVNAEIDAREIIVRGEVIGALKARERVQVWSTGKVTGPIETRGIVIEDGAVLHAKAEVRQKAVPPQTAPPAVPPRAKEAAASAAAQAKPHDHSQAR